MKAIAAATAALALAGAFASAVGAASTTGPPQRATVEVHGDWRIDVRTRTGRLVHSYRFHNEFAPTTGGEALTSLLAGNATVGGWNVELRTSGSVSCAASGSGRPAAHGGRSCYLRTSDYTLGPGVSAQDAPTVLNATAGPGGLILSGSVQFYSYGGAASIDSVMTNVQMVSGSNHALETKTFTTRDLNAANATISITDGMLVIVNITISFG
jgi:hypothetical protein